MVRRVGNLVAFVITVAAFTFVFMLILASG